MDSNLMKQYVDYLCDVRTSDEPRSPAIMVYDSFKGHLEESVKKKFHENGFDLAMPEGICSLRAIIVFL